MVREWKEGMNGGSDGFIVMFWVVLATFSLISAIIFSCAGGVDKDKAST